ncbi:hypothetical protein KY285_015974 [Solanum tuberosum]|nr:hypothetical protein KY285_015974 [Solanum tuberosum]
MKDDESIPVSTPTTAYSSLNTNSIHSKSLYDATLFGRGTVSLRWSAGNLNSLSDLFDIPKSDDLDVLEMEDREKLVNHMWDVYTNSPRIRLLKFWQEAFEAAYEELNSDVAEVREAAISEISKMSIRFVHIDLPPLRSMDRECIGSTLVIILTYPVSPSSLVFTDKITPPLLINYSRLSNGLVEMCLRPPSHEFKWKNEEDKWQYFVKTTSDDDTEQKPRRKISYSSISDDSDNDKVLAKKNKHQSSRNKKVRKFLMMMSTTSPSSSVNENEINFTTRKANWDYYENIDITNEDEEDETETFISSSCKSHVEFSDDSSSNFSQEFDTIYKNTTRRCQKKIGYSKKRDVKNTRSNVSRGMNNIGKQLSISTSTTSSGGELPPRLSVFKKLIPCNVEGKVKESFAIVKKSEDPYEDFKSSMMEMILEKKMFEKNDLEQLLQCFLSLNAKNCHGVIVEAFSEIWKTLFSPNHN